MTSPLIDPSLSDRRLRLAIRFEWMVALAITLVVVWLDVNYARHAGALWRDEANSFVMATYPSLKTTWDRLPFDSFPMLWYVVLRGWVKAGFGESDAQFRIFGLLVNVGIIAILWVNAWRMSRRPPVVALILLGANAAVMMFCGSLRGYGLGLVFGLWMYGAVWAYVTRPTAIRWTIAAAAAALACHTLYYNCVFVAAACLAGASVALSHRRWRVAASLMALGAVTAATLLIYVPTFRGSSEWRSMYVYSGGLPWLWFKFAEAVTLGHRGMAPTWLMVSLCAPLAGLLTWVRTRSDLAQYAATSLIVGIAGNILFLRLLNYYMQPWYFLCLMAIIGAGTDAVQRAAEIGRGYRVVGVALAAVVLMVVLVSPLYTWSTTRRTNLDEVARVAGESATKGDYIILTDWTYGVTFQHYYHGPAAWQTLPPLPPDAHEIHRSDLVFDLMRRSDAIRTVLDSVAQTLREGHRIFYIGRMPDRLPSEHPKEYLARRLEQHDPPAPVALWRYELHYTLHELADQARRIPIDLKQPISLYEDVELDVFEAMSSSEQLSVLRPPSR
jgi:hypothetical protein